MSTDRVNTKHQLPEGKLIESARKMRGLSARQAAAKAGISDARWRQIVNGYASVGAGQVIPVRGPDDTVARMARVAGVSAEQLREAGRSVAADMMLTLAGMEAESEWHAVGSAVERLSRISEELLDVIRDLNRENEAQGQ